MTTRTETLETVPKDYRDPVAIKHELKNREAQIQLDEDTLAKTSRSVVVATGKLAALRKLRKEHAKNAETQPTCESYLRDIDVKIERQEEAVADLTAHEARLGRIVDAKKKLLSDFLRQTPHKKLKTNKELLADHGVIRKLRDELARF
jgi:hypothetical protein